MSVDLSLLRNSSLFIEEFAGPEVVAGRKIYRFQFCGENSACEKAARIIGQFAKLGKLQCITPNLPQQLQERHFVVINEDRVLLANKPMAPPTATLDIVDTHFSGSVVEDPVRRENSEISCERRYLHEWIRSLGSAAPQTLHCFRSDVYRADSAARFLRSEQARKAFYARLKRQELCVQGEQQKVAALQKKVQQLEATSSQQGEQIGGMQQEVAQAHREKCLAIATTATAVVKAPNRKVFTNSVSACINGVIGSIVGVESTGLKVTQFLESHPIIARVVNALPFASIFLSCMRALERAKQVWSSKQLVDVAKLVGEIFSSILFFRWTAPGFLLGVGIHLLIFYYDMKEKATIALDHAFCILGFEKTKKVTNGEVKKSYKERDKLIRDPNNGLEKKLRERALEVFEMARDVILKSSWAK